MYNYKDKDINIQTLNDYMLLRSLSMFDYDGLPTTLPTVEIEKQLRVMLPTYMIPNKIIYLESLPLNKNGKVDRTLLKELVK